MLDENLLRRYVAEGAHLKPDADGERVVEGNSHGPRPKGTYATVLLVNDDPQGLPVFHQLPGGETATENVIVSEYSVQFYREDAVAAARRFRSWAESENGLAAAVDAESRYGGAEPGTGTGFRVAPFTPQRADFEVGDMIERRMVATIEVSWLDSRIQETSIIDSASGSMTTDTSTEEFSWP